MNTAPTVRTGKPVTIARLVVRAPFDYDEPQSHAAHERVVRVDAGAHDVEVVADSAGVSVQVRLSGTLVQSTWHGRPTRDDAEVVGRTAAVCLAYVYDVARAAAGDPTSRFQRWGHIVLLPGFALVAGDDGAILCEATGELLTISRVVRPEQVDAHFAHVARIRARE